MSKPIPLPPSFYQKHEDASGNEVGPPIPYWNQAAVEEAVRQALAAQVPVAWMMTKRRFNSEPGFTKIDPSRVFESEYVRLAIIPETRDG